MGQMVILATGLVGPITPNSPLMITALGRWVRSRLSLAVLATVQDCVVYAQR